MRWFVLLSAAAESGPRQVKVERYYRTGTGHTHWGHRTHGTLTTTMRVGSQHGPRMHARSSRAVAGRRWLSVLHGAWRPCDLPRLEMRMGVSFETRRSTSLCSCRFNSPLRVVCLACCAAVCLFGRCGCGAPRRSTTLGLVWAAVSFCSLVIGRLLDVRTRRAGGTN